MRQLKGWFMAEKPGMVVITKFVRSGSAVFSSYIRYMDRDEAVNGGMIRSEYSAYSEEYMGNPEKTTGLFSMDYDRLSEATAQIYKKQFEQSQKKGSLLWQTVVSFDNEWLEELGIYDSEAKMLDESRIREAIRLFMKTLLEKEELHLAAWTAAVHYNTDNIHVHIAVVDPICERKRVKDGQYAGEPKGTWSVRSIRYAKSAAVNELLELDKTMIKLNDLVRECVVRPLREQNCEETILHADLEQLLIKLEQEVPDFHKWQYGLSDMKPYREDTDAITNRWLHEMHPEEWKNIQEIWERLEEQQKRAYGKNSHKQTYRMNQEKDLYKRCGNAILQTLRSAEQEKCKHRQREPPVQQCKNRNRYRISRFLIRKLRRCFEDNYRHYKNLAAYDRAQRQAQWQQQQRQQEEEAHISEAIWLDQELERSE